MITKLGNDLQAQPQNVKKVIGAASYLTNRPEKSVAKGGLTGAGIGSAVGGTTGLLLGRSRTSTGVGAAMGGVLGGSTGMIPGMHDKATRAHARDIIRNTSDEDRQTALRALNSHGQRLRSLREKGREDAHKTR